MLWGEDDILGRWIQGIAALFLAVFTVGGVYMLIHATFFMLYFAGVPVLYGAVRLCYRCARYALTGRGNVNRDAF